MLTLRRSFSAPDLNVKINSRYSNIISEASFKCSAAFTILMPFKDASSMRAGKRDRVRERETPQVNLPQPDSNWMGRISSVLIAQAVMAEQQCVFWQLWRSPVISTEGQRVCCHLHHLHILDVKVAALYVTDSSYFYCVNVIGLTVAALFS